MAPKSPTSPMHPKLTAERKSPPTRKGLAKVTTAKKALRPKKELQTDFSSLDDDYANWAVPQLKDKCRFYNIMVGGKKGQLIARLSAYDEAKGTNASGVAVRDAGDLGGDGQATAGVGTGLVFPPGGGKPVYTTADGKQTITPPAGGKPPPEPKKPRPVKSGGKKVPKNGHRASGGNTHPAADETVPDPENLKATRRDIERAERYLPGLDRILLQIGQDNAGDDGPFQAIIQNLYRARKEFLDITQADVLDDEPAAEEDVEGEDVAEETDKEDVHDEEEKNDGSAASSPRRSVAAIDDGEDVEDGDEPPRKRSREVESEESEEE
ncbi:hypothetical protein B0A55_04129 [Friedmanniomyces simplex]|uniref:SAP domain-containing protein n=1 Tax=Friedmanniomyces simplex TaxID=329884 RepID=A0A4U0XTK7_9PEZI|nr:hypothetical protein B0A55_04129 [Friedmanniomyces simplex]